MGAPGQGFPTPATNPATCSCNPAKCWLHSAEIKAGIEALRNLTYLTSEIISKACF